MGKQKNTVAPKTDLAFATHVLTLTLQQHQVEKDVNKLAGTLDQLIFQFNKVASTLQARIEAQDKRIQELETLSTKEEDVDVSEDELSEN